MNFEKEAAKMTEVIFGYTGSNKANLVQDIIINQLRFAHNEGYQEGLQEAERIVQNALRVTGAE